MDSKMVKLNCLTLRELWNEPISKKKKKGEYPFTFRSTLFDQPIFDQQKIGFLENAVQVHTFENAGEKKNKTHV